ncbi:972_t:CDS:1, partial [Funneliformis caledonium]
RLTHLDGLANSTSKRIYLLDTTKYTWVDKFEPGSTPTSTSLSKSPSKTTTASSNTSNTINVVIGTISGICGTAILMTIGFLGYIRYQKRNHNICQNFSSN